ncbi:leucine-rich repeat and WD repeat-containing protein 1-like isoform X2 [Zophobas morio]|uniref:leucine-rich repeat and WD repeat-containing protein 1-like isoform X2 n=1 Tax=Zophobas morio TaxID=2755281 RepID=UPI0030831FA7
MPESADGLIIATCGGFTVCIIHVDQEKTVMRYTNPEDSFFCSLAWSKPLRTTLSENYKTTYSLSAEGYCMLAAGTTNGAIHLLLPSCLLCVDLLQRHSQVVTALQFHPKHKTLLLSGSADKTCIVWSISLLTSDKQATNTVALKIIQGGFAVQYSADPKNFSRQPSSNPLTCFRNHFILVDCVRGLPQNQISCIVTKKKSSTVHHLKVVDLSSSKVLKRFYFYGDAHEYSSFFVNDDILVLGDEKGILYLYSLQEALLRTVKPFQTLKHSDKRLTYAIRDVVINATSDTIVAVNSNNMVMVWRAVKALT